MSYTRQFATYVGNSHLDLSHQVLNSVSEVNPIETVTGSAGGVGPTAAGKIIVFNSTIGGIHPYTVTSSGNVDWNNAHHQNSGENEKRAQNHVHVFLKPEGDTRDGQNSGDENRRQGCVGHHATEGIEKPRPKDVWRVPDTPAHKRNRGDIGGQRAGTDRSQNAEPKRRKPAHPTPETERPDGDATASGRSG